MKTSESNNTNSKVLFRVVICLGVLALGAAAMVGLFKMKKPPVEAIRKERPIKVEIVEAVPEDVPVLITGYGEVAPRDVVTVSPEVSGMIVEVHPRLEVGETVKQGEVLFTIDPRTYREAVRQAEAETLRLENAIVRLKKQFAIDRERLKTLRRNRDLARAEFDRLRGLFDKDQVGTQSGVDGAEQKMNSAADMADQMAQAVELYPVRIREAEHSLTAAEARHVIALTDLDRCRVKAPFDGRIKAKGVEFGQYVTPGLAAVTLANDSLLEIHVSLDSRDARRWLRFDGQGKSDGKAGWFSRLKPVSCTIFWTEEPTGYGWTGRLDRVVRFDQKTRTLTVAIQVTGEPAEPGRTDVLPLVEGMYCRVEIPGQTMTQVIRVPRWAVSFENTVYMAVDNRLKTVPVEVARIQGEEAFVARGIDAGDRVITTRLVDPLENALLKILENESRADAAGADRDGMPL